MPNPFFRFKQFTVYQDQCAMKVCTDACILGAYTADQLSTQTNSHILDIGTGTGLLPLMLAQKNPSRIDGVEMDKDAWVQAGQNFRQSPWGDRLIALHGDIREMEFLKKYDFIISNPPFYQQALKSKDHRDNQARHATELNLESLADTISRNLGPEGGFSILLPPVPFDHFIRLAGKEGWHPSNILSIRPSAKKSIFRDIGIFTKQRAKCMEEELIIQGPNESYTEGFRSLLKEYYLEI